MHARRHPMVDPTDRGAVRIGCGDSSAGPGYFLFSRHTRSNGSRHPLGAISW
jgi:hypothetical protein